jgi:RNA polymerase sigma-32 factor
VTTNALVQSNYHPLAQPLTAGSLDGYMNAVGRIAVLSEAEEKALAEQYVYEENLNSAQQLVLSNLRFVVHIARGYRGYGLQLADLIQEGNIGLMKAVKRFDPEKGVRLVAFAVHWIRAEIHEYVIRNWRLVKVATTKAQRKLFFNLRKHKKNLGWLSHEESALIAEDLGVTQTDVREMESRLYGHDISIDGDPDDDENAWRSPAAYLESPQATPAQIVEAEQIEDINTQKLSAALSGLDERARDIVQSRWLSEEKSTLHELADKYGISAERIRQLEGNAIKKLRGAFV